MNTRNSSKVNKVFDTYKYTMQLVTPNEKELHDEERAFLLKFNLNTLLYDEDEKQVEELRKYAEHFVTSIHANYETILGDLNFQNNKAFYNNITGEQAFKTFKGKLSEVNNKTISDLAPLNLFVLCQSMLFLLRTTRRTLFVYFSATDDNKDEVLKGLTYRLSEVFTWLAELLDNIKMNNIPRKHIERELQNSMKQQNAIVQELVDVKAELENEKELRRKELQAKTQMENDRATRKQKIAQFHSTWAPMAQLSRSVMVLFSKFHHVVSNNSETTMAPTMAPTAQEVKLLLNLGNGETNTTKGSGQELRTQVVNILTSATAKDASSQFATIADQYVNQKVPKDTEVKWLVGLAAKVDLVSKMEANPMMNPYRTLLRFLMMMTSMIESLKQIAEGDEKFEQLNKPEWKDYIEPLRASSDLYKALAAVFEELSGSVRVVVSMYDKRKRDTVSTSGGSKKRLSSMMQLARDVPRKRRKVQSGGSMVDEYNIVLNTTENQVILESMNRIHEKFYNNDTMQKMTAVPVLYDNNYTFGPFYSVCKSSISTTDLLYKLNFDSLKSVLTSGKDIILYTYGYSGSGKTYTLFNENKSANNGGILWEMISNLSEHYDVALSDRRWCYGTLEGNRQKTEYSFADKIIPLSTGVGITTIQGMRDAMKEDLLYDNGKPTSVVKQTANNPESSRGFYLLKFTVKDKKKQNGSTTNSVEKVHGSIGIVDMAGNEDPYDIAISQWPTINLLKLDHLVGDIGDYIPTMDNVLSEVYDVLRKMIFVFLHKTLLSAIVGYVVTAYKYTVSTSTNVSTDKKITIGQQEIYVYSSSSLRSNKHTPVDVDGVDVIEDSLFKFDKAVCPTLFEIAAYFNNLRLDELKQFIPVKSETNSMDRVQVKYEKIESVIKNGRLVIKEKEQSANIIECFMENKRFTALITLDVFIEETFNMLLAKADMLEGKRLYNERLQLAKFDAKTSEEQSEFTSELKRELLYHSRFGRGRTCSQSAELTQKCESSGCMLKYMMLSTSKKSVVASYKGKVINFSFQSGEKDMTKLNKQVYISIRDTLNNKLHMAAVQQSQKNDNTTTGQTKLKYDDIRQLIKEGYYINKANVELMQYFKSKMKFNNAAVKRREEKYGFCGNFDFPSYDKFATSFTRGIAPVRPQTAKLVKRGGNGSTNDTYYDTQLVPTIKEMFPNNPKDIMFACIRNDKDVGKAMGAIDTLRLVQDLKSV